MKGLKLIIVVFFIFLFHFASTSPTWAADCYSVEESFIDTNSWETVGAGSGDEASGFRGTRNHKFLTLSNTKSVCATTNDYFKVAVIKTCNNGILQTSPCNQGFICKYNENGIPACYDFRSNPQPSCPLTEIQGAKYNNNGKEGTINWSEAKLSGDTYCIENEVKQCNLETNKWDIVVKKCTIPKCEMELKGTFGESPMKADCKYICNPNSNYKDERCNPTNPGIVEVCEYSGWKTYPITYKGADCKGCSYKEDGKVECIKEGERSCYLYEGKQISASRPGDYYCHNSILLSCNESSSLTGVYKYEKDCSKLEKTTECGYFESDTPDCITPEQAGRDPRNLITITTSTSDAFWCEEGKSIDTAIGCIPITVNGLVGALLPTIFGIAGGIAFLMMVYGFIMISTSSGDEKKVAEAKKIVTSAITGLLFSLFALFLYKLIAIDILHIPGLDFPKG